MAPRDDEAEQGERGAPFAEPGGVDMAFQVVDPHQGQPRVAAIPLAALTPTSREPARPGPRSTATASTPSQPPPASSRARLTAGMIPRTCSREAGSGTTPPEAAVQVLLTEDDVAQDAAPVFHHGGGRLVAAGLDPQDAGHGARRG